MQPNHNHTARQIAADEDQQAAATRLNGAMMVYTADAGTNGNVGLEPASAALVRALGMWMEATARRAQIARTIRAEILEVPPEGAAGMA